MIQINAALVGTGFMGGAHLEAVRRLGDVNVAGVLGSTAEKSRQAAAAYNVPKGYPDYQAILDDPAVQSVHILTPNQLHYEMVSAALKAGKHVLCEKPLAVSSAQSTNLVVQAAESGLAAGVNYNLRFYPLCIEARERVQSGDIGEVYSVQGSYTQEWLLYDTDYNWRLLKDRNGPSRAVADIGTHWLDLTQFITGLHAKSVLADLRTIHPKRQRPLGEVETFAGKGSQQLQTVPVDIDTEDTAAILLRYGNGVQGSLWVSQATAGRKNCVRFEIAGSKGTLSWNSEDPEKLWIGRRDTPSELLMKDPALLSAPARSATGYPPGHVEGYPDTFKQCFRAFYDHLKGDRAREPLFATFADGHNEVVLTEGILESHAKRGWVDVPDHKTTEGGVR